MSGPPDPRALVSAQLLHELVDRTLDPGYAAAAARRPSGTPRPRWATPAVAVACAVIGFLLVAAYVHTHRGAPAAAKAHNRLVARARTAQHDADALALQLGRLNSQVTALRNRALPAGGALAGAVATAGVAAGQTRVHGPGLTATLTDPAHPAGPTTTPRGSRVPLPTANNLTDRDVRSVVDELWHDGAEAIAVNGIRLTPTSTIRFAGDAVLVDYQPISSPYRIEAVGDPDAMSVAFAESEVATRYQTRKGTQGIGFDFRTGDDLTLAAAPPTPLRYAHAGPAPR